jgi:hypothetical protein
MANPKKRKHSEFLPTALVIGPMKSGTTWIHQYLAWRGDVSLPGGVKETFFFDRHFDKGIDWYAHHFRRHDKSRHRAIVEVAPSLFHSADAPERVLSTLGRVPLIVAIRDPVARAWSHYLHLRRKGYTRLPLAQALEAYPEILDASRYSLQITRWRTSLPDVPVTILNLDNLIEDRVGYAAQLCSALELPAREPPDSLQESNAGGAPPSFLLARVGRKTAEVLRAVGGYGVVNLSKRVGLKKWFFGPDGGVRLRPSAEETSLLLEKLGVGNEDLLQNGK